MYLVVCTQRQRGKNSKSSGLPLKSSHMQDSAASLTCGLTVCWVGVLRARDTCLWHRLQMHSSCFFVVELSYSLHCPLALLCFLTTQELSTSEQLIINDFLLPSPLPLCLCVGVLLWELFSAGKTPYPFLTNAQVAKEVQVYASKMRMHTHTHARMHAHAHTHTHCHSIPPRPPTAPPHPTTCATTCPHPQVLKGRMLPTPSECQPKVYKLMTDCWKQVSATGRPTQTAGSTASSRCSRYTMGACCQW